MVDYKLSIANIICDYVINNYGGYDVPDKIIFNKITETLNYLNLDIGDWSGAIDESLQGRRSKVPLMYTFSQYAYDKALKLTPNPTFSQTWVEIIEFVKYFNLPIPVELYMQLEEEVEKLTKDAIAQGNSWDKRVVARLIVKKAYEKALRESSNPNHELVKKEAMEILGKMYGFDNQGLLFAVRDLLQDRFYDESRIGEAISKIATEDIITMVNDDETDFDVWMGRKIKLLTDMELLGDENVVHDVTITNSYHVYLEGLSSVYDIEKAVHREYVVDYGTRSIGTIINQSSLLNIIYSTAKYEVFSENSDKEYNELMEIVWKKVYELLDYFNIENSSQVREELMAIHADSIKKAFNDIGLDL